MYQPGLLQSLSIRSLHKTTLNEVGGARRPRATDRSSSYTYMRATASMATDAQQTVLLIVVVVNKQTPNPVRGMPLVVEYLYTRSRTKKVGRQRGERAYHPVLVVVVGRPNNHESHGGGYERAGQSVCGVECNTTSVLLFATPSRVVARYTVVLSSFFFTKSLFAIMGHADEKTTLKRRKT